MTSILEFLVRLTVWLLLAPLLPGIINKVKAWVAGRRRAPVEQQIPKPQLRPIRGQPGPDRSDLQLPLLDGQQGRDG